VNALPKRVQLAEFLKGMEQHQPDCVLLKLVPPFFKNHLKVPEEFPLVFSRLYREEYSKLSVDKLMDILGNDYTI
jgi:hypothetical protein